jgi:hypothetical protein
MVSTAALGDARQQLTEGLAPDDSARVQEALENASALSPDAAVRSP